jgi:hypothetical protein
VRPAFTSSPSVHELILFLFDSGKTVTLVETCCQLLHYKPGTTILLTAPSNAAADLLCERLSARVASPSYMLRLNAPSRSKLDISPSVKKYCYEVDGTFGCPALEDLKKYKVIISTTISASVLGGVGLKKGHFSHIIVDEVRSLFPLPFARRTLILCSLPAGQGTEPEGALSSIADSLLC